MILICAVITAVGSFALPTVIARPVLLWPLLFVTGAFSYGVFTLALAVIAFRDRCCWRAMRHSL
jgi:hypothetical protein